MRSPWYDQFQRDISFASNIYIVGYSLSDYHIAGLLLANPSTAPRTIFIQKPPKDPVFLRRTSAYGRTMFSGVEGFAKALESAPRAPALTIDRLRSFRSLAPTRDQKTGARPTASEVYDLLVYGDFNPGRLARSQPKEDYAISRSEAIENAVNIIESKSSLVVDGRLGNGKTIFLHLLAFALSARGWVCLIFKPGSTDVSKEIATLSNVDKLILFIEHYSSAQDDLRGMREALPKAKFVLEVRTGTYEVRFHELIGLLPRPFDRISLNALSASEARAFSHLCENAGLRPPREDRVKDLRDTLLDLFDNQSIRERVKLSLSPLFEARSTRRILVLTMLITMQHGAVGASFIRSIIGEDPFTALKTAEDLSTEIFDMSTDDFQVRSPVFSAFVVKTFFNSMEIADAAVEITLAAATRRADRPYRVLMSNMMTYSDLRRTFRGKGDAESIIIGIYERLRFDERVNGEPLFWLQYAIAMAEANKLPLAEEYINTAYRKALLLPGFRTFQIDTQAFRISLLRGISEKRGSPVSNIENIISGIERINEMISENSHRAYAVRVLEDLEPFVLARRHDLSVTEATALQFWLLTVAKSLSSLPNEFKAATGSESIRARLEGAAARFLAS